MLISPAASADAMAPTDVSGYGLMFHDTR